MNSRKIILAKNAKLANSRNSRKFLPKISRIFPFAKVSSFKVKRSGYWHVNRDVHSKAFEALTCYLKDTVSMLLLADLNRYYTHLLHEFGGENFIDASSSSQKLE